VQRSGLPPLETVNAIVVGGHNRGRHKLHKAIWDVTVEDTRGLRGVLDMEALRCSLRPI
jgi:hypothetical protein